MKNAILLSPSATAPSKPKIGFLPAEKENQRSKTLRYNGEKHLITFAPTGAGKGRSCVIPTLLSYSGPTFVLDPKGENYLTTAKYRRSIGHQVVLLDPFGVTGEKTDSFNIFDLLTLSKADPFSECQAIASDLSMSGSFKSDPYWDDTACNLITGIIAYLHHKHPDGSATMQMVTEFMFKEDLTYHIAVILDTEKDLPDFIRDCFIGYISIPSDKTRPCVDSTANTYLNIFRSPAVSKALQVSSFNLQDFIDGKPIDIYLVFPPDKVHSHKRLIRHWTSMLMKAVFSRRAMPKDRTLFILDETAILGQIENLSSFFTLSRGYGVQIWLFFQDLQLLRQIYKEDYFTLLSNAGVLQIFGVQSHASAVELQNFTGVPAHQFRLMPANKQHLIVNGTDHLNMLKIDYLNDSIFSGKFCKNPIYKNKQR